MLVIIFSLDLQSMSKPLKKALLTQQELGGGARYTAKWPVFWGNVIWGASPSPPLVTATARLCDC